MPIGLAATTARHADSSVKRAQAITAVCWGLSYGFLFLKRSVQRDLAVSTLAHDVFVSVVGVRSLSGPCKASFVLKRAFWDHHEVVLIFRVEPGHRRTQQNRVISFLMPID